MVYLPVLRIRIVIGEQTTQKIHASKFNLKETVGFYFFFSPRFAFLHYLEARRRRFMGYTINIQLKSDLTK